MESSLSYNEVSISPEIKSIEDYVYFLDKYGVKYEPSGYHLKVGEPTLTQGWILHISVVKWQIPELLDVIIPVLLDFKVAFKILKDKTTANNVLDGNIGGMIA